MLEPKRAKYRKQFRGKRRGQAWRGSTLAFGDYGLKSLGRGWLASKQIEAARKVIAHHTKRAGKVWIRVFPSKPVTKKAAGVRMGSGKGAIDHHVAVVTPGRIIFELAGMDEKTAREAIRLAGEKLPFKSKFIKKE
jgi:large subunit ribosomal protein L16